MNRECADIDECKGHRGLCEGNLHCTNTVGSFTCGCLDGYETVVINDWDSLKRIPSCLDINECTSQEICPDNSLCQNTVGDYNCQCHAGYQGSRCTDIDECALIKSCDQNATCSNSNGSYKCSCDTGFYGDGETCKEGQCDDRSCPLNQKCLSPTAKECVCNEGLTFDESTDLCQDIDECLLRNSCDGNATCANLEGSYTCKCNTGYFGNGETCEIGDCKDDACPLNEECVSPRGIECQCKNGFERDQSGPCVDVDECFINTEICDENADCLNTDGSYKCSCRKGFFGNGVSSCFIGSCSASNCRANQKCVSPTGIDCECIKGFVLNDKSVCDDFDECASGTHLCSENASCANTVGSFNCTCKTGFSGNGLSCLLSDRCAAGFHNCHADAMCENTDVSYSCICKKGFIGNGASCSDLDECTTNAHDCISDSNCHNTIGSFTCSCEAGVGELCRANWILVLNTMEGSKSLMIDGKGKSKEIKFTYEYKTQAQGSCSIVWQSKMYIFGGNSYQRQISVVDQCKLTSIGELQFNMNDGACAQRDNTEVFICFEVAYDPGTTKNCHRSNGPLEIFTKLPSSTFDHGFTRIAVTSGEFSCHFLRF